jgi:peptidyl-prolyl cis-trans isomerase C
MRLTNSILFSAFVSFSAAAQVPTVPLETPLIVDGDVKVDAGDVEGYLLRVPEEKRADFRTSYDRVAGVADALFVSRSLAAKARASGMDKDPLVQRRLQQAQETILADAYAQKLEKALAVPPLEQRALELYKADAPRYVTPEEVNVQHILVNLNGRTKQSALERATEIAREARSGKEDFLVLAARYSDDPDMKRNGGDLGRNSPKSFVPPVRDALAKMKAPGEISDPIESEYGYHIFKFIDRTPATPIKFEAVKAQLIKSERERLQKQASAAAIQAVRSSPTVMTYRDNVESLVVKIDPEVIKRAVEAQRQSGKK